MRKTALVLLCILLVSLGLSALAQVKKSEVVYATLDAQGGLQGVYIVNLFESAHGDTVEDFGDYTDIIPLSDGVTPVYDGEKVIHDALPGRSAYQGNPRHAMLPWTFEVRYALDGDSVTAQALSGAHGLLSIHLSAKVNEALSQYAQSTTLQISLTLDGDKCLDVDAPGATLAYAGGNIVLTYVLLPGLSGDMEVNALVQDFSMAGLQIAGVKMAVDEGQYVRLLDNMLADNPLKPAVTPLVRNFLASMAGSDPQSFADVRNGAIDSLQFVIMAQGIAKSPRDTQADDDIAPEKTGYFDKLLALFGM